MYVYIYIDLNRNEQKLYKMKSINICICIHMSRVYPMYNFMKVGLCMFISCSFHLANPSGNQHGKGNSPPANYHRETCEQNQTRLV